MSQTEMRLVPGISCRAFGVSENEIMAMLDKHDEERARQSKSETSDDADFTSTDSDHALGSDTMSVGESKGYSNQEGEEEVKTKPSLNPDTTCQNYCRRTRDDQVHSSGEEVHVGMFFTLHANFHD